ncbi:MAG: 5'-nucleotidase C-terminal domain-containing protein [Prevotella sp.]|nr:5'-nucleotidase C-terminal domain-containing protein [Prevotella sp.]
MRKSVLLISVVSMVVLSSCKSHYQMNGIERSRILVDKRYAADSEANAYLEPFKQRVDSIMSPVVGEIARYMAAQRPESELSNLLADILVWGGKAYNEKPVFGVYNMGGIRAAFAKGKVTYGDVLEVAPFENKICFFTLTGEKVLQLFREMATTGGEAVSHGVKLVFTKDKKLKSALLNGKEIDPNAKYRVVSIDYLAQGNDKMEAFKSKTDVNSPQEESNNVRYIIMNYFREQAAQGKVVDSQIEGRIVVEE